jgi:hypothetical protein
MTFTAQNWISFGAVEGEDDLVEPSESVAAPAPKLQETIWYGSKPAPEFKLVIDGEEQC